MIAKNVKTRRDYLKQHSAAQGELNRHGQADVTKEEFTLKIKPMVVNLNWQLS